MSEQGEASKQREIGLLIHHNKYGYRGIFFDKKRNVFRAYICPQEKRRGINLGSFRTPEEAAQAYDDAARDIYGKRAFLNFPKKGEKMVRLSRAVKGFCPRGHDLKEHGYKWEGFVNKGKANQRWQSTTTCRMCNKKYARKEYRRNRKKSVNPQ